MIILKITLSIFSAIILFFLTAIISDLIIVKILEINVRGNFNAQFIQRMLLVASLPIGFIIGWKYLSPFIINKAKNHGFKISKYLPNLKKQFKRIIIFRLFVVMQILGVFIIFFLLAGYDWSVFDIFKKRRWEYDFSQNFLGLISIFGPFFITKSIDWILDAKD